MTLMTMKALFPSLAAAPKQNPQLCTSCGELLAGVCFNTLATPWQSCAANLLSELRLGHLRPRAVPETDDPLPAEGTTVRCASCAAFVSRVPGRTGGETTFP